MIAKVTKRAIRNSVLVAKISCTESSLKLLARKPENHCKVDTDPDAKTVQI